jgi:glycosyltransferase involved in cell wall biosynthesis
MRILQTVKYYEPSRGGMESVVKDIVHGVCSAHKEVEFTVYSNHHIPTISKDIRLLDRIKVIKERTPFVFRSQPLNMIYWNLKTIIRENDIIHHHYPFPNMELALLRNKALLNDKKLIITWHANIKNSRWSFIQKYYNPIIRKLLDRADHVIVTSPQLLEASDILGDYRDKVSVIPLSFSTSSGKHDQVGKKLDFNRRKSILFVGKLRSYKGVNYLIKAIVGLDVDLKIVGTGEEELNLKKQVEELNLSSHVQFLKDVNDQQLQSLYKSADLFVLPSINEAEAFGVVQLEAMSNGLPVINTNLKSGVPFVSLHEITGITVEPQDAPAISRAIQKILSDDVLYNKLSGQSVERARSFTREVMADAYYNLYTK